MLMDVEIGLLAPERLGIGKPLFRSRLFEFVLGVTGVISVTGLSLQQHSIFTPMGSNRRLVTTLISRADSC